MAKMMEARTMVPHSSDHPCANGARAVPVHRDAAVGQGDGAAPDGPPAAGGEPPERRRGPRVEQLVLTPRERAVQEGGPDGAPPEAILVTLWAGNPEMTASLRFHCAAAGITLEEVDTAEALLGAAARSAAFIIDCSSDPDALARGRAVVPHTTLLVLICHPEKGFVDDLRSIAAGELVWLPPEWLGSRLRDKLRLLLISLDAEPVAEPDAAPSRALTPREQEVLSLKAAGHSTRDIADMLGISKSTVKSHIANALEKREDAAGDGRAGDEG